MERNEQMIQYFTDHAEDLAAEIVERVCEVLPDEIPEDEKRQAHGMYVEFWKTLAEMMRTGVLSIPESLLQWSRANAAMQTKHNGSISVIADRYPPSREALVDLLVEIGEELDVSLSDYAQAVKLMNRVLDYSLSETYYAFERLSELYKSDTEEELAELSAPLVPVYDGIVIIPFIGRITDERASAIMEKVLPRIAALNVSCTIADFSGLAAVDDHVLRSLQQIEGALGLMGVEVISTGMRPELARKIADSGVDLAGKRYYGTVKLALESMLRGETPAADPE
ncbi:hypothetical protein NCCP2716_17340 [Sporosarcina sp. NCCP-2716]|uniref:STAS domain-containing protein n=1 Tax=Sporosarcina sp. NCCP-2716 TaxID=2943679 RepID=UPI00203BFF42|nr:STAS domain-containing protein [Sporosarcina sp. NCCP-2716]GKV69236.1 hypothetical protein NCCP2716_17340 [Sporosarcina sp. NCCP-2716]